MRKICLALCLTLLASPALAGNGIDLSLHYGVERYDAVGLKSGLGGVSPSGQLKDASTHVGATAIFWNGMSELGAIGEIGALGNYGNTTLLGLLGGLGFDMGPFRLEALGELGGHKYGDVLKDKAVVTRGKSGVWLVSVGVRPGLSIHFGPGDMMLVGVWAFARWDVTSQDVRVNMGGTNESVYTLGGSQFGAALRVGFRL